MRKQKTQGIFVGLALLTGLALLATGLWLIYHPAALIVLGSLLLYGVKNYVRGTGK